MTYSQRNSHRNAKKWGHVLGFKISDMISAFRVFGLVIVVFFKWGTEIRNFEYMFRNSTTHATSFSMGSRRGPF